MSTLLRCKAVPQYVKNVTSVYRFPSSIMNESAMDQSQVGMLKYY